MHSGGKSVVIFLKINNNCLVREVMPFDTVRRAKNYKAAGHSFPLTQCTISELVFQQRMSLVTHASFTKRPNLLEILSI